MKDTGIDDGSKGVATPGSNGEWGARREGGQERQQDPGGGCERKLSGPRQDGHAARGQGDLEVHVEAGGSRLEGGEAFG